jgi:hypothetical protein
MTEREIDINDKIRGIYANLEDIKRLLENSKGYSNKQVFNGKIQEHNAENLKFVQELNGQGVTNEEIQRRLREVPILMHDVYSKNSAKSRLAFKNEYNSTHTRLAAAH